MQPLIRTAALLGTPSKTLLSGTPEFVRGSRQFCDTVSERKGLHTLFPRWASIDERTRVPDEKQEALIWTREQGYDAVMEMILVPRCTCLTEGDCLRRATRKLLQELIGFDKMCCDKAATYYQNLKLYLRALPNCAPAH